MWILGRTLVDFIFNIVLVALFVLTGIVQYAVLSAVAGSLVNRAEETSKAIMPVMYLAMIGYFGGLVFSFTNTQSPILTITSYIPYWSSFAMHLELSMKWSAIQALSSV